MVDVGRFLKKKRKLTEKVAHDGRKPSEIGGRHKADRFARLCRKAISPGLDAFRNGDKVIPRGGGDAFRQIFVVACGRKIENQIFRSFQG